MLTEVWWGCRLDGLERKVGGKSGRSGKSIPQWSPVPANPVVDVMAL